jgi:RNA polymerase sigma-70 factor (ECF subfamily)
VKAWDDGGSVEPQLIEAARRGDREAFDAIVRTRLDTVHRTAFTILGNEADAQDATQETFLAAWRNLPGLRDTARFDAWLGRITVNACRMALRRRGTVREIPLDLGAGHEQSVGGAGPAAQAADAEAFDRAFARLSVEDRAILVFHHHQELGRTTTTARPRSIMSSSTARPARSSNSSSAPGISPSTDTLERNRTDEPGVRAAPSRG